MPTRSLRAGFTLVELVVFIAVAGLAAAILVQAYSATGRGASTDADLAQASQLAAQRMEIIVQRRRQLGFKTLSTANYDPCQLGLWVGPECATITVPAGSFTVRSAGPSACGTTCKEVTVQVLDPYGQAVVLLTRQFWNY